MKICKKLFQTLLQTRSLYSQLTPEEQCRIVSERLKEARLYQVGSAKIAGINFSAKTTLDVRE
jgi:hypothetical protein